MGDGIVNAVAPIGGKLTGFGGNETVGDLIPEIVGKLQGNSHNKVIATGLEGGGLALHKNAVVTIHIFKNAFWRLAELTAYRKGIGIFVSENAIFTVENGGYHTFDRRGKLIDLAGYGGALVWRTQGG